MKKHSYLLILVAAFLIIARAYSSIQDRNPYQVITDTQDESAYQEITETNMVCFDASEPYISCDMGYGKVFDDTESSFTRRWGKKTTITLPGENTPINLYFTHIGKTVGIFPETHTNSGYIAKRFEGQDAIYIYNKNKAFLYDEKAVKVKKVLDGGTLMSVSPDGNILLYLIPSGNNKYMLWLKNRTTGDISQLLDNFGCFIGWENNETFYYYITQNKSNSNSSDIYQYSLATKTTTHLYTATDSIIASTHYLVSYKKGLIILTNFITNVSESFHVNTNIDIYRLRFNNDESKFLVMETQPGFNHIDTINIFVYDRSNGKVYQMKNKYLKDPYYPYHSTWSKKDGIDITCYQNDKSPQTRLKFSEVFKEIK